MPKLYRRVLSFFILLLILFFSNTAMAQPKAGFTVSNAAGCSPLKVNFTNTSTGGTGPYTYLWKLGNSNTSAFKDASAIYYLPGKYYITLIVTDASGKTDSVTQTVTVYTNPTAGLKANKLSGCPPLTVSFKDNSSPGSAPITSWLWDFGDGSTSTSQNPGGHTYTAPGKYSVSLNVTDKNGCSGSIVIKDYINVNTPPTADFTNSNPTSCTVPYKVDFTSKTTSATKGLTYAWDFGDGSGTSNGANPSHTYYNSGAYTVTLTVTDDSGCTATVQKSKLILLGQPQANFSYDPGSGCAPLKVSFYNKSYSGSGGNTYIWFLGDGSTSTDKDPVHTYGVGLYDVTLVVKTNAGCTDTMRKRFAINASKPFTPKFDADTIVCKLPGGLVFKNTSGPGTHVVTWDFGNKVPETGEKVTHVYDSAGLYDVTMTVADDKGCVETITKKAFANVFKTDAYYLANPSEGCVPLTVQFTDKTQTIDSIVKWEWDFADGSSSNQKNPVHTFMNPGDYKVLLTVTTLRGCTSTYWYKIKAGKKPKADFTWDPDSGCLNNLRNVHFYNTSSNTPVSVDSFKWIFGANATFDKTAWNPIVRFEDKPGNYDVTLIVYNHGCSDTMIKRKLVHIDPPYAKYEPRRDSCPPNVVHFTDQSIGGTSVKYFFGDGDSSVDRNPVHKYTSPGFYYPFQIVYDSLNGCSDTFSYYTPINPLIIAPPWFDTIMPLTSTSGCLPFRVKFYVFGNMPGLHKIYFGDGDSVITSASDSLKETIWHTYTKPGTFRVKMNSYNSYGCEADSLLNIVIRTFGYEAKFGVSPVRGCVPLTVTLTDSSSTDKSILAKKYVMGDGTVLLVTSKIMTYTYKKPPANQDKGYTIIQLVADSHCTNSTARKVYPLGAGADFLPLTNASCDTVQYEFAISTTGPGPFRYHWDFGDGDTSSEFQPVHDFKTGTYKVLLSVWDKNKCRDTVSHPVVFLTNKSKADFAVVISQGTCPPFTAQFLDKSLFNTPGPHTWDWDFGDGSPHSSLQNPTKVYYTAGTFNVKLTITDAVGCKDSIVKNSVIVIKGPVGDYSFDTNNGCLPLTVHFVAQSKNATKFVWDLGDGKLGYGDTLTHTYYEAKHYLPLLILSDLSGCTYTLPPKDTIFVNPPPIADFAYDSTCQGQPVHFVNKSDPVAGFITSNRWDFGDGGNSLQQDPMHTFKHNGYFPVKLTVTNSVGCDATVYKKVRSGNIIAGIIAPKDACLGSTISFTDATRSDSAIASWYWMFGDGGTSADQNPTHTYFKKGVYKISLVVTNFKGCFDSLINGAQIVIGDTLPPEKPVLYRVTVVDDHNVEIDFSRYRDVDFWKYILYRKNSAGIFEAVDSTENIDDTILVNGKLNTLRNVYCYQVAVRNACGKISPETDMHCTIDVSVKPGINAAYLTWTPYVGWKPRAYRIYRQSITDPPGFEYLDSVRGDQLKYTDSAVICYWPMIYRIRAIEDAGYHQKSWSDTTACLPLHVSNVPPADIFRATVENNISTRIEWTKPPKGHVKKWILEKSDDGGQSYVAIDTPIAPSQFYAKDEMVDVQKTSYIYRVKIMDSCGDIGDAGNIGKTILLKADTGADDRPYLTWTAYRYWPEGVQYYDVELKDMQGNWQWIARTPTGKDTAFTDNITDLNSMPHYCYHVIAHRNGPLNDPDMNLKVVSQSNDDCVRPRSKLWVPNVFTPNGDGTNDSFFVKGMYIKEFHMKIFDRWGTKVFETTSMKEKWGGDYRKGQPILDAYKYLIYYRGIDGEVKYLDGWVTVLM